MSDEADDTGNDLVREKLLWSVL